MNKPPCVYMHRNPKNNEVFYIGKASDNKSRPYQRSQSTRSNDWWKYVESELDGDPKSVEVELINCDTEGDALKLEWDMITEHSPVCNKQYVPKKTDTRDPVEQLTQAALNSEIKVFNKTPMSNLTNLWAVGNAIRLSKGKSLSKLAQFLKKESTLEFIEEGKKRGKTCVHVSGKGPSSRTWASVELMMHAARYLDTAFHLEVIDLFITNKILEYRDSGGDKFKALNVTIDRCLPGREDKDSNKGIYMHVAKLIREKCGLGDRSWNAATADELRMRDDCENRIADWLDMGLVRDWDHLKELIEKL
jgi:hypothetical protein